MPKGDHRRKFDKLAENVRSRIADGETQEVIARDLCLNRTTVQRWCKRFGWETQRTGPRSGPGHPNWKGGRMLLGGYWQIYSPDHPRVTLAGYVAEHRLVVEKKLGRFLESSEVVHHIDGDRLNNSPENLQVFRTNREHLAHDLKGRVPKWTPDGLEKQKANRERIAILRKSGAYARRRTPQIDRRQA